MSQDAEEQRAFVTALLGLAEMCGHALSRPTAEIFTEIIRPHGLVAGRRALLAMAVNARPGKFPSPGDVLKAMGLGNLEQLAEPESDREVADRAADRILQAISSFGRYCKDFDKLRAFIGDAAWATVQQRGGWSIVVEQSDECEIGIWKAQMRDSVLSVISSQRRGTLNLPVDFPNTKQLDKSWENSLPAEAQHLLRGVVK